ncbi:MAG: DUF4202 domain-containing protein [Methylobacteriaceae bacterium]|nr:DUF4202 domain-containing protein [Methylobacteriaceae bacterium]
MDRLAHVLAAIDAANAADPGADADGAPSALVYGRRMSARLAAFAPDAGEALRIAARGQHIERWAIPRGDFPMDRVGYLKWRNAQKDRHAARLGEIMAGTGYDEAARARVAALVRKEGLKRDAESQTLEDVACLVFLEHEAAAFMARHDEAKCVDIVEKTWRKMSPAGQDAAKALTLDAHVARIVAKALAG